MHRLQAEEAKVRMCNTIRGGNPGEVKDIINGYRCSLGDIGVPESIVNEYTGEMLRTAENLQRKMVGEYSN